jgi:hypothetical protein
MGQPARLGAALARMSASGATENLERDVCKNEHIARSPLNYDLTYKRDDALLPVLPWHVIPDMTDHREHTGGLIGHCTA